jgi:toxin-antitoxin system PIN domain toxin
MLLPDVNVLVYAHRLDSPEHSAYARWLGNLVTGHEPFAMSELVMSGFQRLVTNRRVFAVPTPPSTAMEFLDQITARPGCRQVRPGPRHWEIFRDLCTKTQASGALVADVYHAALAIEHGCEWVTSDGDFARIPGLRWRHPLAL